MNSEKFEFMSCLIKPIHMKIMFEGNIENDRKFLLIFKYLLRESEFTFCLLKLISMKIMLECLK